MSLPKDHDFCLTLILSYPLAGSDEESGHHVTCPVERHMWCGTKGGLWLTDQEGLRAQSNDLQGTKSANNQ